MSTIVALLVLNVAAASLSNVSLNDRTFPGAFLTGLENPVVSEPEESLTLPLPASVPKVDRSFGQVPLRFERNEGQLNAEAKFLARGPGYHLVLTNADAMTVLFEPRRYDEHGEWGARASRLPHPRFIFPGLT